MNVVWSIPLAASALVQQAVECPSCVVGSSAALERGFLWGMILMMVVPTAVVVGIGGGLLRARRRALRDSVERFLEEESGTVTGS